MTAPPTARRRHVLALLTAGALALAIFTPAAHADKGDPENLVKWREGLTSSAQPTADYLARVKAQGFDMVINLAPPQSQGSIDNEGGIIGKQGVVYVNIPVNFGKPTAEDFRVFTDVMKSAAKNVLVHCQVTLRGSSFTFLYRVIHENAPVDDTRRKLLGVWEPDPVWKKFIKTTLEAHGKKVEIL